MTKYVIAYAAAIVAIMAADRPDGTSSGMPGNARAEDTCRPQPLCRAYVDQTLIPAPAPRKGVVTRGPSSATSGDAVDQKDLDDDRRLPASEAPNSGK